MHDAHLISLNHSVQSLTTGLIANNAPIRPMQALMPPCTRHILSLYEERMQRRSRTTLSIGFSLHPFLNDRFAEQTDLLIIISLFPASCRLLIFSHSTTLRAMQTFVVQNIKLVALLSCKIYLFCCARYFLCFYVVRCADHWSAGAKPLQVPPPSSGKGVGGWGTKTERIIY